LQVSRALLDQGLVVGLSGAEEQLALEHVGAGGAVENIEPLEPPIPAREDLLVDDPDLTHGLPGRIALDAQAQGSQGFVDGFLLEAPQRPLGRIAGGRWRGGS